MFDFSSVVDFIENTIRTKHQVPGCDLVITRDHKPVFRHISGYADRETKTPLTQSHMYYMYSCTKPLTVTAGLRLLEEGKLDLETPVSRYFPSYANVKVLQDGKLVPANTVMTLRHLFTMTAGYDYEFEFPETSCIFTPEFRRATTEEVVEVLSKRPLIFHPGERFSYSICHDILAGVIEKIADMRFSEYLDKIIFTPLGMTDSTFSETPALHERMATQYLAEDDGSIVATEQKNEHRLTEEYESGGAGLISTVNDYAKFADTLACGGTTAEGYRMLRPETVKFMHTEQLHSYSVESSFTCPAGPGYGYGLGVRTRVNRDEGQRSPIGEFGWDGAAGSYVLMDETNRLSVFFGMHVLNWPSCIGTDHAVMRDLIYDAMNL